MILPPPFLERIREATGSEVDRFLESLDQVPPVSVRVNPFKPYNGFSTYEAVAWASNAYYLPARIPFTMDPHFHAGCYYVQEASSMYLEQVIRKHAGDQPLNVLDLCAAPGGKSTQLISVLPKGSLLVSNEVVPSRNNILRYNIEKWGHPGVVVTQADPSVLGKLSGFFDVIVVDAPCSGEGLFRKDPDAVGEWSTEAVTACARRQADILGAIYPALKENGLLIYSTCTFEHEENEHQVSQAIARFELDPVEIEEPDPAIVKTANGLRFYPHRIKGEGFFIAAMRKRGQVVDTSGNPRRVPGVQGKQWLSMLDDRRDEFSLFRKQDELYAIPESRFRDFMVLTDATFVRKAGIHLGTLKGDDLVPSHDLALSIHLSGEIPRYELSLENAIRYLRCDTIPVPEKAKGWAVVTFDGYSLGWMKAVGNRVNNYFPKNQRILKG